MERHNSKRKERVQEVEFIPVYNKRLRKSFMTARNVRKPPVSRLHNSSQSNGQTLPESLPEDFPSIHFPVPQSKTLLFRFAVSTSKKRNSKFSTEKKEEGKLKNGLSTILNHCY